MTPTVPVVLLPDSELRCPHAGWLLLRGTVRNDGAGVFANIEMDLGSGSFTDCVAPIPITRKGTVLELIRVPQECLRLRLRLDGDVVDAASYQLLATSVGYAERVFRMWWRVVPMLRKYTRRKRLRAGLTLPRLVFDLQTAYRIAGSLRAYAPQMPYDEWLDTFDRLSRKDVTAIRRQSDRLKRSHHFIALVSVDSRTLAGLVASCVSLAEQFLVPDRVIVLAAPGVDSDAVAARLSDLPIRDVQFVPADDSRMLLQSVFDPVWCVHLQAGDRLAEHALYWVAVQVEENPQARILYSDDDLIDADGQRSTPRFKPAWSLELLRSTNYIGSFFAFSGALLQRLSFCWQDVWQWGAYGFLLALIDTLHGNECIEHIPALLSHHDASLPGPAVDGTGAVRAHLLRRRVAADVMETGAGVVRVAYALSRKPLVSIVIPTRDASVLLRGCVDSILGKTGYRNFELLLIDNRSVEHETAALFSEVTQLENVRVLPYDTSFNYSAMNNLGVAAARGEVVCLLNNDTEVITADWLEVLVGHLLQEGVGVVGAKLLYPDGRVQHGGDTVGPGGCAHHLHSFIDRNDPGYCNRAIAAQDLSAVTAACLVTWRCLYQQLGGLDEQNLKVAFNDVDYCLRVREAGYRVVWTPHAQLYHYESASRGKNDTPEKVRRSKAEADYIRKRWGHLMDCDPYYNVNCSYERPDFSLSNTPDVEYPWRR